MSDDFGSPKPEPAIKSLGRRRRGYGGRGTRGSIAVGNVVNAAGFDRWVTIGVAIAAIAYVGLMGQSFHADTVMLGFRPTGAPDSEILYGWGRPEYVRQDGQAAVKVTPTTPISDYAVWQYPAEGGGIFTIHFNGSRISDRVSCTQASAERGSCPGVFGIGVGDMEEKIVYKLGSAPERVLSGTRAVLRYPSIGVEFELEQFRVRRISLSTDRSSIPGRIPRLIRYLVP